LAETEPEQLEPKYLVSSGASFDRETAMAIPGFSIYRKVCQNKRISKGLLFSSNADNQSFKKYKNECIFCFKNHDS
jgi:hypothetical protein